MNRHHSLQSPQTPVSRCRGFTLLEVLIAVSVFAVLAAIAYGGLNTILRSDQVTAAHAKRLGEMQKAWSIIERDISQMINRPIRDAFGEVRDAISVGAPGSGFLVEFSRAGHGNPLGLARSSLQRVGYRLSENQLIRLNWQQLDSAQGAQPREAVLLTRVTEATLEYLDEEGKTQNGWPPLDLDRTQQTDDSIPLPAAIRFSIELEDVGEVSRLLAIGLDPVSN